MTGLEYAQPYFLRAVLLGVDGAIILKACCLNRWCFLTANIVLCAALVSQYALPERIS